MGEVLRRLIAKCVLSVARVEAQEAWGIDQICGALQAGIGGDVHRHELTMGDTEDGKVE